MFKKNLVFSAMLAVLALFAGGEATATILTFDDLVGDLSSVPEGYGGFDWNNATKIAVIKKTFKDSGEFLNSGYVHGAVSGANTVFNWNGGRLSYIDWMGVGTFDFNGAYWASAWEAQNLTFKGYKGGQEVYRSGSYAITTQAPLWIELNWAGIDRLEIVNDYSGNGFAHWAMDNFTFNQAASVPEPTTLALLGIGLAGMGFKRRQRA